MKQSLISMAVLGALCAQPVRKELAGDIPHQSGNKGADVHDARSALTAAAQAPKVLNAEAIKVFFQGTDADSTSAEHAKVDKSRMAWLVGLMFKPEGDGFAPVVDVSTVKSAVNDYTASIRTEKQYKPGKKGQPSTIAGQPITGRPSWLKSAQNRAGEVRNIYGAMRWLAFNPIGKMGWGEAASKAGEMLASQGLNWDGTKKPTDADRKARKVVADENAVNKAFEEAAADKAKELGRSLTTDERVAILADAERLAAERTVADICDGLVVKYGPDLCEAIAAYMPQAIENSLADKEVQTAPQ